MRSKNDFQRRLLPLHTGPSRLKTLYLWCVYRTGIFVVNETMSRIRSGLLLKGMDDWETSIGQWKGFIEASRVVGWMSKIGNNQNKANRMGKKSWKMAKRLLFILSAFNYRNYQIRWYGYRKGANHPYRQFTSVFIHLFPLTNHSLWIIYCLFVTLYSIYTTDKQNYTTH